MADLAAFVEPGFDPVAWINAQCKDKLGDDGLERFLSELEMRLLLAGEEVEATLTDSSSAALRRIPYAQQEVSRLRADISALQVGPCVPPWQLNHPGICCGDLLVVSFFPLEHDVVAGNSISRCRQPRQGQAMQTSSSCTHPPPDHHHRHSWGRTWVTGAAIRPPTATIPFLFSCGQLKGMAPCTSHAHACCSCQQQQQPAPTKGV